MQWCTLLSYGLLFVHPTVGHVWFGFACKILLNLEKRQISEWEVTVLKLAIKINAPP